MMGKTPRGMRDSFFDSLFEIAKRDKDVILVTADCGAPSLDVFREKLKRQYFTVGIAEQNMVSVAAGLALEGKTVYMYAIAPFVTLRCYEQIKVDLCCMNLKVTGLGVGAGFAYDIMGPTHHTTEDISIMRALPNMTIFNPSDSAMAGALVRLTYELPGPKYVRFDRTGLPEIYADGMPDLKDGMISLKDGGDILIVATGNMVKKALDISDSLSGHSIRAGVLDLFRIKPIDGDLLLKVLRKYDRIATLEEHFVTGGIGSAVAEIMVDRETVKPLLRLGICDKYFFEYGGREHLHCLNNLDTKTLVRKISEWMPRKSRAVVTA